MMASLRKDMEDMNRQRYKAGPSGHHADQHDKSPGVLYR